jgi:formamidopyrimidine-DNA glycosylase
VSGQGGFVDYELNQKRIAGIGNVYSQDPLFKAGIHLLRPINTLSNDEIEALWQAIRETLQESIDHGGSHWEQNLYGEHGGWDSSYFLVAYRERKPGPACGTAVDRVKTEARPRCQSLETGQ